MPPSNEAAWITATRKIPLEVKPAPYTPPGPNKVVIRIAAVAINPIDWIKQVRGDLVFPWIKYPFILGSDVAGEVVEIGVNVTRVQIGDRIVGHALGTSEERNDASESAFQLYVVLEESMTTKIPDSMSYETAVVLPLGLSTAACGLFQDDMLRLDLPRSVRPKPTGQTVLIWGGSTSVGLNAIQLAVAAGYEVFTTSSPELQSVAKARRQQGIRLQLRQRRAGHRRRVPG
jgi:NADPH:quinone reductase-like Zn-dependent oxidoreductase